MKKQSVMLPLVLLALVFLAFLVRRWNEPVAKEAFNRDLPSLSFTKHARCRMACRQIDEGEVREILTKGAINFNKPNRRANPCPIFALQGRTANGERLRVIVAQCPKETNVITCYNLDVDFYCDCPGDQKKEGR